MSGDGGGGRTPDTKQEIVRLLTEIRDEQRADLEWRRRVVEESTAIQQRSLRWQRLGLLVAASMLFILLLGVALVAWLER